MVRMVRCAFALAALLALPLAAGCAADTPGGAPGGAPGAASIPNEAGAPKEAPDLGPIRKQVQMGRYKEALPLAEAAVAAAPESAAAHLLYGRALIALEQPKNAIAALGTATRLDPKSAETFTALGDAHFLRSGVELREWLKKNQITVTAHKDSGVLSSVPGGGHVHTSSFTLETVVNDRSATRMKAGDWEQYTALVKDSLAAYNAALALDPTSRAAARGKGLAQLVLGSWKDTAAAFEAAGAPAFDSFIYELARNARDARSMSAEAMRFWAAAEQSDPTNPWAYWYQRDLYEELKRTDWRYGYYDAMALLFSDAIKDRRNARDASPKDALKALQSITEAHADFAPAWRGRGIAALALKDAAQARTAFEKAAGLDENDWFSHLQLGVALLNEKSPDAETTLAKAAKGNPESPIAWHTLGVAIERNKDPAAAVYCYERAASLAPASPEAHYSLGALLLSRRQDAQALPHLQRYLELKPDAPDAQEVRSAIDVINELLAPKG